MKAAFVVLALALAFAQASVIPLAHVAGHGLSYTAVSGPALVAHHPAVVAAHHPAIVTAHGPAVVAAHAPAAVAVHAHHLPAVAVHPHVVHAAPVLGGTYVAKTRGAAHVAPLPGHLNSASSINLQPAPGTW